jgi:hypothetical protein
MTSTLNPRFIVFVTGPENNDRYVETIDAGAIVSIGFVHGPQKLNGRSGKIIHSGIIEQILFYVGPSMCHFPLSIFLFGTPPKNDKSRFYFIGFGCILL